MPDLDQLFARPSRPEAFGNAQVWEARVARVNERGVYVVVPAFDRKLRWGPCLPQSVSAAEGDRVAIAFSDQGRPWILAGANGANGGEASDA